MAIKLQVLLGTQYFFLQQDIMENMDLKVVIKRVITGLPHYARM